MPRIPVESKHTYQSYSGLISGANIDDITLNFNVDRPIIQGSIPLYPSMGVDENQRIGRKIRTDSLVSEFFINLFNTVDNDNLNTIYDYYTYNNSDTHQHIITEVSPQQAPFNTNEQDLDISIRHFIVEFDRDFLDNFEVVSGEAHSRLFDWFYQLNIFTGKYNMHSNRQQVKRESTQYTGNYSILYDKIIHLSLHKPIYHGNVSIPYIRHLNFDGEASEYPSNKVVIQFFIGPTNIYIDYGSYSLGQFIENNPPDGVSHIIVAELSNTLKLSYTDV